MNCDLNLKANGGSQPEAENVEEVRRHTQSLSRSSQEERSCCEKSKPERLISSTSDSVQGIQNGLSADASSKLIYSPILSDSKKNSDSQNADPWEEILQEFEDLGCGLESAEFDTVTKLDIKSDEKDRVSLCRAEEAMRTYDYGCCWGNFGPPTVESFSEDPIFERLEKDCQGNEQNAATQITGIVHDIRTFDVYQEYLKKGKIALPDPRGYFQQSVSNRKRRELRQKYYPYILTLLNYYEPTKSTTPLSIINVGQSSDIGYFKKLQKVFEMKGSKIRKKRAIQRKTSKNARTLVVRKSKTRNPGSPSADASTTHTTGANAIELGVWSPCSASSEGCPWSPWSTSPCQLGRYADSSPWSPDSARSERSRVRRYVIGAGTGRRHSPTFSSPTFCSRDGRARNECSRGRSRHAIRHSASPFSPSDSDHLYSVAPDRGKTGRKRAMRHRTMKRRSTFSPPSMDIGPPETKIPDDFDFGAGFRTQETWNKGLVKAEEGPRDYDSDDLSKGSYTDSDEILSSALSENEDLGSNSPCSRLGRSRSPSFVESRNRRASKKSDLDSVRNSADRASRLFARPVRSIAQVRSPLEESVREFSQSVSDESPRISIATSSVVCANLDDKNEQSVNPYELWGGRLRSRGLAKSSTRRSRSRRDQRGTDGLRSKSMSHRRPVVLEKNTTDQLYSTSSVIRLDENIKEGNVISNEAHEKQNLKVENQTNMLQAAGHVFSSSANDNATASLLISSHTSPNVSLDLTAKICAQKEGKSEEAEMEEQEGLRTFNLGPTCSKVAPSDIEEEKKVEVMVDRTRSNSQQEPSIEEDDDFFPSDEEDDFFLGEGSSGDAADNIHEKESGDEDMLDLQVNLYEATTACADFAQESRVSECDDFFF